MLDVESDLFEAHDIGEEHLQRFLHDWLITEVVPFHGSLPTLKLKAFSEMTKTKSVKVQGKDIVRADRGFFLCYLSSLRVAHSIFDIINNIPLAQCHGH